jgi:hypothetical protein
MLKGIAWMKVSDMDEINPIINLFHNFLFFIFLKQNINVTQKKAINFLFFVFHSLA